MRIQFPKTSLSVIALSVALALSACGGDSPEKLIASAKESLVKRDPGAAIIHLKNVLAKNPNSGEARFLLGKALLESGDSTSAEVELRKAIEFKYPNDEVVPLLARTYLAKGQFKKVIDEFGSMTLGTPAANADLKTSLAISYGATGNTALMASTLDGVLTSQPDFTQALIQKARLKASQQDVPGAIAVIDGVLAKTPNDYDALLFKASLLNSTGKTDDAVKLFLAATEAKPDAVQAYTALVMLAMQSGKLDEASKYVDLMKQKLAKSPQTVYLQSLLAYRKNDLKLAKDTLQGLLKTGTKDPRVLTLAGSIEYDNRSDLQAQEYLSQAIASAPNYESARLMLIDSYIRTGQTPKAVAALQPALQNEKLSLAVLNMAGRVYLQTGDVDKAENYYSKAAQLDPKNAKSKTAIAMIHIMKGGVDKGFGELEQIASVDTGIDADQALIATSLKQNQFDRALKAIVTLEKKLPNSPIPNNLRGNAYLGKGDVANARKSFEQALAINPTFFPAAAVLARLDIADKKPEDAKRRFDNILAKDAKNPQALMALAGLKASTGGKPEEVIELLKKAIATNPNEVEPRVALVNMLLQNKESKKAVTVAQEALAAIPERPEIIDAAGRAFQESGDFNQAASSYNKLIQLLPSSPQTYMKLAEAQSAGGNKSAARETIAKGLVAQPEALVLIRAAIGLDIESGRVQEALTRARNLQKQFSKAPVGYLLEGDIYASQKGWKDAVAAYKNALKVAPVTDVATKVYIANISGGLSADAQKFADEWNKSHPKDLAFQTAVADVQSGNGNYTSAIATYKRVLEATPNNPMVLNNLAYALYKQADKSALGFAEQANKLAPQSPPILDTLGVILVEQGQTQRGLELQRKAVELAPNAAVIRLNLASSLIKAGQKSDAKKELETLSKLGDKFPKQDEVKALLKGL